MTGNVHRFEQTFIDEQRDRLQQLRRELLSATSANQAEEIGILQQAADQAQESEDDAQKLAQLEIDGNLVRRNLARLTAVDRALKKVEEGTYGLSDASGKPLSQERLKLVPEAVFTIDEQRLRDAGE